MLKDELLQKSGAGDAVTEDGFLLLLYPYAPYLKQSGILPLDAYYPASNKAYKAARSLNIGRLTNACDIKALLEKAGMTRGRNTLILHPEFGSYFVVQAIAESGMTLPPPGKADKCGNCRRCEMQCPAGAIEERFQQRLCLRDLMDREPTEENMMQLGNNLLGCMVCREVCRFNKAEPVAMPPELAALLKLETLLQFSHQTQTALADIIGANMARAAILLPQAAAAAVRQKRTDLIPGLQILTEHRSEKAAGAARIAVKLLSEEKREESALRQQNPA